MDASELSDWMAYEMLGNDELKKKLEHEVALENSAKRTAEQRAADIKRMFEGLTNGSNR